MFGYRMQVQASGTSVEMRPLVPADAPAMTPGLQSYEICRYLDSLRSGQTEADELAFIERARTDPDVHVWGIAVAGVVIGCTSLEVHGNRGTSGIVIYDHAWWGQGIASATHAARTLYACDVLDLMAIDSFVVQGNTGSRRALEKVGYAHTGVQYHFKVVRGRVCHADRFTLVNPSDRAWGWFWGESPALRTSPMPAQRRSTHLSAPGRK
jgi:RimJ/RimL family protein N-acetyltransferase